MVNQCWLVTAVTPLTKSQSSGYSVFQPKNRYIRSLFSEFLCFKTDVIRPQPCIRRALFFAPPKAYVCRFATTENEISQPSLTYDRWFTENFEPNQLGRRRRPPGAASSLPANKLGHKAGSSSKLALAVASGEKCFRALSSIAEHPYLALEDTRRRLQSRANRLLADSPMTSGCKRAV